MQKLPVDSRNAEFISVVVALFATSTFDTHI
jgi:hypothetical protein